MTPLSTPEPLPAQMATVEMSSEPVGDHAACTAGPLTISTFRASTRERERAREGRTVLEVEARLDRLDRLVARELPPRALDEVDDPPPTAPLVPLERILDLGERPHALAPAGPHHPLAIDVLRARRLEQAARHEVVRAADGGVGGRVDRDDGDARGDAAQEGALDRVGEREGLEAGEDGRVVREEGGRRGVREGFIADGGRHCVREGGSGRVHGDVRRAREGGGGDARSMQVRTRRLFEPVLASRGSGASTMTPTLSHAVSASDKGVRRSSAGWRCERVDMAARREVTRRGEDGRVGERVCRKPLSMHSESNEL